MYEAPLIPEDPLVARGLPCCLRVPSVSEDCWSVFIFSTPFRFISRCIQIECCLRARGLFAASGPLSLRGPLAATEGLLLIEDPKVLEDPLLL